MPSFDSIIDAAWRDGRRALYEHEVGALLTQFTCFTIPRHIFARAGESFDQADIDRLGSGACVLKLVAPDLAHKSEIGAVRTAIAHADQINRTAASLLEVARASKRTPAGVLCCEHIEHDRTNPASELFVGVRVSREFGPVLAAGFGGVNTEFLAGVLRGDKSVAMAVIDGLSADAFLELFRHTACYDLLAGRTRGAERVINDGALLDCFDAFITLANRYCNPTDMDAPRIQELEVNPFAVVDQKLIPLDGVCRLTESGARSEPRPIDGVEQLLHPDSIAIVGVSTRSMNMGRVILGNLIAGGFDRDRLWVIRPGADVIDHVPCAANLSDLPHPVDLLVVAVSAEQAGGIVDEVIETGKAKSVILIPGGLGETDSGRDAEAKLRARIAQARERDATNAPVFLGGNCLGALSRPGHYDTLFIPDGKLNKRLDKAPQPVALVSQSGAFAIARLSNLEHLAPSYVITCGNQTDLTVTDLMRFLIERTVVQVFGVYVEGFDDLDGLAMVRAIRAATAAGKTIVFYKAGRTSAGRRAVEGHTAAIAGAYPVCTEAMTQAGALVTETFGEFESALMLAVASLNWTSIGTRMAAVSNAGYEAVGIADHLNESFHGLRLAHLCDEGSEALSRILDQYNLSSLVNLHNPLDLTPMAPDAAHADILSALLNDSDVDAVIHSFVPQTPAMKTTPEELGDDDCLTHRLPAIVRESGKPVVLVIDSGRLYDPYADTFVSQGLPVFRSADIAVKMLNRIVAQRLRIGSLGSFKR